MKGKFYLLTLILCLVSANAVAGPPRDSSAVNNKEINKVGSVQVDQKSDGTYITIEGSAEATYSVFKLQKPLRLFVDISNSQLGKDVRRAPLTVRNGIVDQVAVMDFSDELQQVTRVIVGFEKAATYDVRTEGNKVVVFVQGAGSSAQPVVDNSSFRDQLDQNQRELSRAHQALASKERRLAESEQKVAQLEKALRNAKSDDNVLVLQRSLKQEQDRAGQLRDELASRESTIANLRSSVSSLQNEIEQAREERDASSKRAKNLAKERDNERSRAKGLAKERDVALSRAEKLAKEREAAQKDSERFAKNTEAARRKLKSLEQEYERAQRSLSKAEKARSKAIDDAAQMRDQIADLRGSLNSRDLEAEKARRQVQKLQSDLQSAQTRARSGDAEAEKQARQLEADLKNKNAQLAALNGRLDSLNSKILKKEKNLDKLVSRARQVDAEQSRARKAANKAESDRLRQASKAQEAEQQRLKALERSRSKEEERIAALKRSQDKEEGRLNALKRSQEMEEGRLAALKRSQEMEEGRLAALKRSHEQEEGRLEALKRNQEKEEGRLAALKRNQEMEEGRLKTIAQNRKSEEARLASLEKDRKAEEARLNALKKELENEKITLAKLQKQGAQIDTKQPSGNSSSHLVNVSEEKNKAVVRLNKETGKAIVETENSIKSVRFQQKGDVSRIIIDLDQPGNFETVPWKNGKAELLLKNVDLPKNFAKELNTRPFGGTVHSITSEETSSGVVRVVASVPSATTEIVRQDGSSLFWEFSSVGVGAGPGVGTAEAQPRAAKPSGFTSAPGNFVPSSRRKITDTTPPWLRRPSRIARKRMDIDIRGADVANILRLIATEGNVNIVAGNGVRGRVTLRLKNVLLADAFLTVLKSLNLGYEQDGEVIRVAPAKEFSDEAKRRREDLVASFPLEPLEIVLMPINYGESNQIMPLVNSVLSSRGTVSNDTRTNTLIIKDVAQNLAAAQQLILSLDTQTPQVLIEARIVETNDRFTRRLGIQWGGDFLFSPANGNPTGLAFPSVLGVAGAATDGQTPTGGLVGTPNFAVNLPAPIGTGSGGGLGLTLGNLGGTANLSLRLSALEDEGQIKIVSSPKILTLDNQVAQISQGTSIPISVVSAAGVQTQFIEANLQLSVTPHVTQDGNVRLSLSISKSEPDFENTGAAGDPSIIRRDAQTQLLLGDGDTTVIGGIYSQTTGNGSSKVPFLADIPILGFFFRDYSENEIRSELLIFITPRIVNRETALESRRLNPIDAPSLGEK